MTRRFTLLLAVWVSNSMAAPDEHRLQACLSLEVAQVHQAMPEGLPERQAFRMGYAKGFDFLTPYESFIRSMPGYAGVFPGLMGASTEAGARMARNLSREVVGREVSRCRTEFLSAQSSQVGAEKTQTEIRATAAEDLARATRIAASANAVFFRSGAAGLATLSKNCYAARGGRGLDCLVTDRASMFIVGMGVTAQTLPYFQESEYRKRRASLIDSGRFSSGRVTALEDLLAAQLPQILVSDAKAMGSKDRCIVHDPDIAESYRGECIDGFASGYGVAKGRDLYMGEFKDGYPHGRGKYIWGSDSRWRTEEYAGWYHKGTRAGFGVSSIAPNGDHPGSSSFKQLGELRNGRLEVSGVFSGSQRGITCATEAECLEKIRTVRFDTVSAMGDRSSAGVSREDVVRATRNALDRDLPMNANTSECVTTELVDELLGGRGGPVSSAGLSQYARSAEDKQLLVRVVGYCLSATP